MVKELPQSILFCCDHNAVRSPMAEGIMKKFYGLGTYVQSVGFYYYRYLFFYLGNLINDGDFVSVNQIASTINYIDTNLLVGQSKRWIENKEFEKFGSYFSCNNENCLLYTSPSPRDRQKSRMPSSA